MKNKIIPYILSFLFFTSLGFGHFSIDVGFSLKPYMLVTCAIFVYMIFSHQKSIKRLLLFEYMFGLFLIVVASSYVISYYPSESLRFTANAALLLVMYLILRSFFTSFISFKRIQESIARAGIIVGLASLIYYIAGLLQVGFNFIGNDIISYGLMIDRSSPRLIGTASDDPNFTAVYLSIFFFFFLLQKKHYIGKLLSLSAIVLTFSRGAYLAIAVALIVYYIYVNRGAIGKNIVRNIVGSVLLVSCMTYVASTAFHLDIVSVASSRFEDASSDNGSGRTDLWANSLTTFQQSPLYGIGANSSLSYNSESYNNEHYVHNTYLEVLSELGLIGLFVHISGIAVTLKAAYKSSKYGLNFSFLLFLGIILQMIFLSMMTSEVYMLGILMVFTYGLEAKRVSLTHDISKFHKPPVSI